MTAKTQYKTNSPGEKKAGAFVESLRDNAVKQNNGQITFDSAAAAEVVSNGINQHGPIPNNLVKLFDEMSPEQQAIFTKVTMDSVRNYETDHGMSIPPDLLNYAFGMATVSPNDVAGCLGQAMGTMGLTLDSTSLASDGAGLQPNRALVAVMSAIASAAPWVHYLPADIGSRKAKVIIVNHQSGAKSGGYAANGMMDGIYSGEAFVSGSRIHSMNPSAAVGQEGNITGKITAIQTDHDTCDQNEAGIKLIRGQSIVLINGIPVAEENQNATNLNGAGTSVVSGSVTLGGTTYSIGGTINTDTGAIALTTTPAMPNTVNVVVEAFVDFERSPDLASTMITAANVFDITAKPWRANTWQTPEARSQMINEIGLDPNSESIMALQLQAGSERHYQALSHAVRLSANNVDAFDFAWTTRNVQLNAATIFNDVAPVLGRVDQQMANDTIDHGLTHLYVGKKLMSLIVGLPREIFEPSGLPARPGIYRIGRLWNKYDVYYTPKRLNEASTSAQMLGIGRSTQVARSCVVMGDAVPLTMTQFGVTNDQRTGSGAFGVGFVSVNPHTQSAKGSAMIEFTNLF